ncbi:MAG: hypothetical protein HKN23_10660 [Verrucomicrobiales bacterium]|nr:hypothetical protein [Verrucomicrobiales bacterium]
MSDAAAEKPDEEGEEKSNPADSEEEKPQPTLLSQISGLGALLLVFGILYLIATFLPGLTEQAVDGVKGSIGDAKEEENLPSEATGDPPGSPSVIHPVQSQWPIPETAFREDIVKQLGGPGRAEILHIALSKSGDKVNAALKLTAESGEAREVEILLEQDEFGSFVTGADSALDTPIKIWKQ